MNEIVRLDIANGVARIQMDDGGKNLVSPLMLSQLNAALDQAERQNAIVVLTGREDVFSAGFDLNILRSGVSQTYTMLMGGFKLARRLLSFKTPVIVACNGHAIAMGAFILLSGDYRIGVSGDFKIVANEVEIGLAVPYSMLEVCRQRLSPGALSRASLLSEQQTPETAMEVGFFDQLVTPDQLEQEGDKAIERFKKLDFTSHYQSKLRLRKQALSAIDKGLRKDKIDFVKQGFNRLLKRR